jgi:hypothetical protein
MPRRVILITPTTSREGNCYYDESLFPSVVHKSPNRDPSFTVITEYECDVHHKYLKKTDGFS